MKESYFGRGGGDYSVSKLIATMLTKMIAQLVAHSYYVDKKLNALQLQNNSYSLNNEKMLSDEEGAWEWE